MKIDGKEIQLRDEKLLYSKVMQAILSGVSTSGVSTTANYEKCLEPVRKGGKVFVKGSEKALQRLNNRNLSQSQYVALMVDGTYFGRRTVQRVVVCALGVTAKGHKRVLGLITPGSRSK